MTSLNHPIRRETATTYRGRPLIVELHPGYALIREKGKRHSVSVGYAAILELGYKLLAREARPQPRKRK